MESGNNHDGYKWIHPLRDDLMDSENNHHEYKWKQPLHDDLMDSGCLGDLVGRALAPGVEGRIQLIFCCMLR